MEALLVICTDRIQKLRQIAETVTPVLIVSSSFHQCFLNMIWCMEIRRSNTHVVDLLSLFLKFKPPFIERGKNFISK